MKKITLITFACIIAALTLTRIVYAAEPLVTEEIDNAGKEVFENVSDAVFEAATIVGWGQKKLDDARYLIRKSYYDLDYEVKRKYKESRSSADH